MTFEEGEKIKIFENTNVDAYLEFIRSEGWDCKATNNYIIIGKRREIDKKMLADILRTARRSKYLERKKVAKQLGVAETTMWSWEVGRTIPKNDKLKRYCEILGLDEKEVWEECRIKTI